MSAGLEIRGNKGTVQIDSTYTNYALRSKLSVKGTDFITQSNVTVGYGYTFRVTGHTLPPLVFVGVTLKGKDDPILVWCVSKVSNGVWDVTLAIQQNTSKEATPIYVFGPPLPISPSESGIGLQVFNAKGEIVFDSNQMPLRVIGVFDEVETLGLNVNGELVGSKVNMGVGWSGTTDDPITHENNRYAAFISSSSVLDSKYALSMDNAMVDYSGFVTGTMTQVDHSRWLSSIQFVSSYPKEGYGLGFAYDFMTMIQGGSGVYFNEGDTWDLPYWNDLSPADFQKVLAEAVDGGAAADESYTGASRAIVIDVTGY